MVYTHYIISMPYNITRVMCRYTHKHISIYYISISRDIRYYRRSKLIYFRESTSMADVTRGIGTYILIIMSVQCRMPGFTIFVALGCTKSNESFRTKHKAGKGVNV